MTRFAPSRPVGLWLAIAVLPGAMAAQPIASVWLTASGTALRSRTAIGPLTTSLSGVLVGGEGGLIRGPLDLRVSYAEGSASTGPIRRDHVEGSLFIGVRPLSGLAVGGGPHAIAFATDSTSERWVEWQVRARYDGPVIERLVRAYVEGWVAVAGSAGTVGEFGRGRGGGAGLEVRLGTTPLVGRLGYAIGESRLRGGSRRETVEGLTLAIGYGR